MAFQDTQNTPDVVENAQHNGLMVSAFNVPYLPMVEPVIRAVVDQDSFALVETARLEWIKFSSSGPASVMEEFVKWHNPNQVRLHLDHVPLIDEDDQEVEYLEIILQSRIPRRVSTQCQPHWVAPSPGWTGCYVGSKM